MKKVKALLLSAGFGTRLRPLTLNIPKCLVQIKNKPILEFWLDKLESSNIESVLINTHYLHSKVEDFINKQPSRNIKIIQVYEKKLLGTAGTLLENKDFFRDSIGLLIHSDNYGKINLNDFLDAHKKRPKNCLLTMMTFNTKTPTSCGIVETDSNGVVVGFHEKVSNPPGNKANGAIFAFEPDFVNFLKYRFPNAIDFSKEILPELLGHIYTWHTNEPFLDIGSPFSLAQASQINIDT